MWTSETAFLYAETVQKSPQKLADLLQALREFLGANDMMAYLTMMAPRLLELHRVLRPSGSLYLHCDQTASHLTKLLMEAIFGGINFQNEIIWQKTRVEKAQSHRFAKLHDSIFF